MDFIVTPISSVPVMNAAEPECAAGILRCLVTANPCI